jgi:hypothetical protein
MIWEYTQPSKYWQHYFAKAGQARIKKDVKLILYCQAGYSRFSGKLWPDGLAGFYDMAL